MWAKVVKVLRCVIYTGCKIKVNKTFKGMYCGQINMIQNEIDKYYFNRCWIN